MAFSTTSSIAKYPYSAVPNSIHSVFDYRIIERCPGLAAKCQLEESSSSSSKEKKFGSNNSRKLGVGSPVVFIEAPITIKTANSMPCLRVNTGLVKPGDVGRIISRKPKDVWAVRVNIGTYLIDGKYFKALEELEE